MAERDEPFPMGAEEIRQRLGVSTQRAYIIVGRKDFPDPWRQLARGKVWRSTDVEAWIREHRPELAQDE
jgi:prophage regulatory protein